ncbi:DUF4349 domain-containing protein [Kitasatospora sp. NPDC048365]|uniref:DUF4349 domain-containing protein n=1 Tax=Kitasatospora sp. NPDC048365 TaxID=3364050 RepID=UPI003718D1BF
MDVRGRRVAVAAAVAAVLLVGGCSAEGGTSASDAAKPAVANGAVAPQAAGGEKAAASGGPVTAKDGATAAPTAPRLIAYKAQLTVRVENVGTARGKALLLLDAAGGYVSGESSDGRGDGVMDGTTLTLKVPSAEHRKTLDALAALGTTLDLNSQADDVTQQVADVESRLKSQRASVDRVRALMAEAKSLAEVVSLEGELTRREADLESLQRQQQDLSAKVSMSTVTLRLVAPSAKPSLPTAEPEKGFWASVGGALSGGWDALVTVVKVLLMALAAVAPFLLVAAPLLGLVWWLRRGARRRPALPVQRSPHPEPGPEQPQEEPAGQPDAAEQR